MRDERLNFNTQNLGFTIKPENSSYIYFQLLIINYFPLSYNLILQLYI